MSANPGGPPREREAFLFETEPGRSLLPEIDRLVDRATGKYSFPPHKSFADYAKIHAEGFRGAGQIIAIVDTGIDDTHPLLSGSVLDARDFTVEGTTADRHGHGTLVALILRYCAPEAKFINAKAFDRTGRARESVLAAALEWVGTKGATVVNLSAGLTAPDPAQSWPGFLRTYLSHRTRGHWLVSLLRGHGFQSCPVCAAADRLTRRAIVCVAVGNQRGVVTCPGRTRSRRLIKVGTATVGEKLTVPTYSSLWPDLVAPELPVAEGTSFSTPFVSGASALLAQAIEAKSPRTAADLFEQGDRYFAAGDYGAAAQSYAAGLPLHAHVIQHATGRIAPGPCLRCQAFLYPVRTKLGMSYLQLGEPAKAIEPFQDNATAAPNFPDAHMNLGAALRGSGRLADAIDSYQRAIALNPKKAEAFDGLGDAHLLAGEIDLAARAFVQSNQLNPRRRFPLLRLAELNDRMGQPETAAKLRSAAAQLN